MYLKAVKSKENKCRAVANSVSQKKSFGGQSIAFIDNRFGTVVQKNMQESINNDCGKASQYNQLNNRGVPVQRSKDSCYGTFDEDYKLNHSKTKVEMKLEFTPNAKADAQRLVCHKQ